MKIYAIVVLVLISACTSCPITPNKTEVRQTNDRLTKQKETVISSGWILFEF